MSAGLRLRLIGFTLCCHGVDPSARFYSRQVTQTYPSRGDRFPQMTFLGGIDCQISLEKIPSQPCTERLRNLLLKIGNNALICLVHQLNFTFQLSFYRKWFIGLI